MCAGLSEYIVESNQMRNFDFGLAADILGKTPGRVPSQSCLAVGYGSDAACPEYNHSAPLASMMKENDPIPLKNGELVPES